MLLWFSRTELNASRPLNIETTAGTIFQPRIFLFLKGYCSGQSHFLEIDAKLAEENEFVTHFVQKCLETRKNEQNVVFRKRSETARKSFWFWYLPGQQLMMAWAEVILPDKLLLVFRCFTNKMVLFWFAKSKAINSSVKDYFDRSIYNFQRLARQKTIQIRSSISSSHPCIMRALGSSQRNRFPQTSLSKV